MCGRFVSTNSPERIAAYFGASFDAANLETTLTVAENYNVAPTNDVYASKMINARGETVAEKPAFKKLFASRRVLIPMDGFYEWKQVAGLKVKQPMYIHRRDGEPLAVAGLWSAWRDPSVEPGQGAPAPWLHSCTVITTTANATMAPVHDRMPVLVPASRWHEWLDPNNADVDRLGQMLVPAPDDLLVIHQRSQQGARADRRSRARRTRRPRSAPDLSPDRFGRALERIGVDAGRGVGEVQLPHVGGGDHVDVRVRHLVAGHDQPYPVAREGTLLGAADAVGDGEEMGSELIREVHPVVVLGDRHHECMPDGEWVDRHEHHALLVAMDEDARDLAFDDPREDRGHQAKPPDAANTSPLQ
ncbi:MAG: hypothetical protein FD127_2841 [Acidimicrobiaceae bacterium]|nr:MAG: hypothetical protein FD127_2841 [Acidimicrobiaceae bacterium]